MSARFTLLFLTTSTPAPTGAVEPSPALQPSLATVAAGGLFTRAARGGTPRRELLWISDLAGEQIGVVS